VEKIERLVRVELRLSTVKLLAVGIDGRWTARSSHPAKRPIADVRRRALPRQMNVSIAMKSPHCGRRKIGPVQFTRIDSAALGQCDQVSDEITHDDHRPHSCPLLGRPVPRLRSW